MSTFRIKTAAIATAVTLALCVTPALANPGNGNGNGNGNGKGNSHSSNHGNSGDHGNSGNQKWKGDDHSQSSSRKNYGKPDHVDRDISYATARQLAVDFGLTGYKSLPPGIAKNLARGKPLPPGIAKKTVPGSMLDRLPYYPGYEWQVVGDNLVLIALSTAIVTTIINGVFD